MGVKADKRKLFQVELQEVQEDLRDLELYIETLYNFLPLAIVVSNPIGIIVNINRAFENLTGFQSIEIVGQFLKNIFLETKTIEEIEEELLQKKIPKIVELTLVSKEKKEIPVRVAFSIRKDMGGNFIGYFVGITDITELKRHEEELEERVEERTRELRERIEELEKFHRLTVGRELKMVELREEVKKLEEELEKSFHLFSLTPKQKPAKKD